ELQSVRVVYLRAVVVETAAICLVEQEHRGERGDADHAHFVARENDHVHIRGGFGARGHDELEGTGTGLAFQARVDGDRAGLGARAFDPEVREGRKLFAAWFRRVDRQAARREAVEQVLGHGAKVARSLENQKFIPDLRRVDVR